MGSRTYKDKPRVHERFGEGVCNKTRDDLRVDEVLRKELTTSDFLKKEKIR